MPLLGICRSFAMPADGGDTAVGLDMADLLGQLDQTAAAGREASMLRQDRGPRIPHMEDVFDADWQPPPSREQVKQRISGEVGRHFNRFLKSGVGDEFSQFAEWRPQIPSYWEQLRIVTPDRSVRAPPHTAPPRFRSQPELMPETHANQCHPMHRKWLREWEKERFKKLYPVVDALKKVDQAKELQRVHQMRREITRDLQTRPTLLQPQLSENSKASLNKMRLAMKTTQAFKKMRRNKGELTELEREEQADKERIERAKSAPALALSEPTPPHRPRHLANWVGPDRDIKGKLRETTPWRDVDEIKELKSLGRLRSQAQ